MEAGRNEAHTLADGGINVVMCCDDRMYIWPSLPSTRMRFTMTWEVPLGRALPEENICTALRVAMARSLVASVVVRVCLMFPQQTREVGAFLSSIIVLTYSRHMPANMQGRSDPARPRPERHSYSSIASQVPKGRCRGQDLLTDPFRPRTRAQKLIHLRWYLSGKARAAK